MKKLCLLICLLILNGCASTPQSRQIPAQLPDSLPPAVELADTPFLPQSDYQCGPAALATVLQFHGLNITPDELTQQIYIPDRKGSLQIEISAAARRHGMLAYPIEPQLRELFTEVAAGNPVLVLQNLSFSWYPTWHYAVVIGYDTVKGEVILRSATTKRWVTPFEVFERTWQRANFWALAIVPAGHIPQTATPLRYLQTAYAFEETGHPKLALMAYKAACQQWPGESNAWMALGNIEYANANWLEAINAFSITTKLKPKSITSWNNLAYALLASGCKTQAQAALQCALNISPDDKNLQDSRQELNASSINNSSNRCPQIDCK